MTISVSDECYGQYLFVPGRRWPWLYHGPTTKIGHVTDMIMIGALSFQSWQAHSHITSVPLGSLSPRVNGEVITL